MKSGFVSLVGRPNVGKSTLLNSILNQKVAITSNKPQTTRNIIQGIYNDEETQIVFVDTPGIHRPINKLGNMLNKQAYYSIKDVDVILFLTDVSERIGQGDKFIIEELKATNKPVILLLNKIDKIKKEDILFKISQYKDLYPFKEIIPLSALKKDNIETLIKVLKNYLTDEIQYFPIEQITNKSENFIIAEIVREKVFRLTEEEVPHSVTCVVEELKHTKKGYFINVSIIVDRDSLKKIIIGHKGQMIKEIGIKAREDIEKKYNDKVYLELFVKTIKKWREKEKFLSDFGFKDFE